MSARPFDRQAVLARFGGDKALLRQVAAIVDDHWPQQKTRLAAACATHDLRQLHAEAHAAKGVFANLAATAAVAAARELESAAAAGDAGGLPGLVDRLLGAGDELVAALRAETGA